MLCFRPSSTRPAHVCPARHRAHARRSASFCLAIHQAQSCQACAFELWTAYCLLIAAPQVHLRAPSSALHPGGGGAAPLRPLPAMRWEVCTLPPSGGCLPYTRPCLADRQGPECVPDRGTLGREGRAPLPTISLSPPALLPVENNLSHGGGERARLFLYFSNRWQVGPPAAHLSLLHAAGVECRLSAPEPCMRCFIFPSLFCSRHAPGSHGGQAASCVRPVVTGCDRAGPRAPARQMVVRLILCLCLEGREDHENQPNPGFPRNPSLAPLPLLSTVCSIFCTHPPTPEPAPSQ